MTYEYVCESCGHQWEAEQSIKDRPLESCVSCNEKKAKRLVSGGTGFLLKGGGWYADLYGSPGSGSAKSGDNGSKPSSSATKADTSDATGSKSSSSDKAAASSASTSSASTSTSTSSAASTAS